MTDSTASEIVAALRKLGQAKADPIELLMVEGLKSKGISEPLARAAARECSNQIWKNSVLTGAAAVVIVSAVSANIPGAIAGGSSAVLGGVQTLLHSNKCSTFRQMNGFDLLTNVNEVLRTH